MKRANEEEAMAGNGWREVPLIEAVLLNPASGLVSGETYPYVDMAAISPGSRNVYPVEEREFRGAGSKFLSGDTLMARITPCLENGKIARYLPSGDTAAAHGSTEFIVIRGRPDVTENDFAYYLACSPQVRNYAVSQMSGTSGRQRVPIEALNHLTVPLPPLPEQRRIAHVLGTLDDKIELNRRVNETLEAMARALFKSWFVDFEPVRAKAEGRDTGLPPEVAALFPDRLVESELGQIPAGWGVKRLGDCFNLTMGQSPPGSTYNAEGEGLPFFQGRTDFGFRYPANRKFCTAPTRTAKAGDTLVSVRAPVGDINMAWETSCIGRGVAALRHKSGSTSFTYYAVEVLQLEIGQYEHTGTVFGAITKEQFLSLRTVEPPAPLVDHFRACALPLDEHIRTNTADSCALAAQRDILLPRLVSGEVRMA